MHETELQRINQNELFHLFHIKESTIIDKTLAGLGFPHLNGDCLDDNKRQTEIQKQKKKNVRETCPTYSVEDCWEV